MAGKVESKGQFDADILRAHDIVPPYKERNPRKADSQGIIPPLATEQVPQVPVQAKVNISEKVEIPKFDLAEQIMAEQRKITAVRRKAPGKNISKNISDSKSALATAKPPARELQKPEPIVEEIVARDIRRFCQGTYAAPSSS